MRTLSVAAIAAILGGFLAFVSAEAQDKAGAPPRIAIVDIGEVFKGYERKNALEKEVNRDKEEFARRFDAQKEIIETLRKALDVLPGESPAGHEKRDELKLEVKKAEALKEILEDRLKRRVETLTLQILEEIEDAVHQHAREAGLDIVLKKDSRGWGDERFQERIFRAQIGTVLHVTPRFEITEAVIKRLNDPESLKKQKFR